VQKSFCCAMFLLAVGSAARAGTWDLIVKSDDGLTAFYLDSHSLAMAAGARRARLLYDYQQTQQDPDTLVEHRSVVVLASADCRNYRLATVQATAYADNMAKGRIVTKSPAFPKDELRYVTVSPASGSVDDKVLQSLCALKKTAPARPVQRGTL
jgi:hypothetical protein